MPAFTHTPPSHPRVLFAQAYDCYKEALTYDPANKVAASRSEALKLRLDRLSLKN